MTLGRVTFAVLTGHTLKRMRQEANVNEQRLIGKLKTQNSLSCSVCGWGQHRGRRSHSRWRVRADEEMRTTGVITLLAPITSSNNPYHFQDAAVVSPLSELTPVLGLFRSYEGRLENFPSITNSESMYIFANMQPDMEQTVEQQNVNPSPKRNECLNVVRHHHLLPGSPTFQVACLYLPHSIQYRSWKTNNQVNW